MARRATDLVRTAHVLASVGWFGAVVVFLALALAGLASELPRTVTAAYLAMELASRYAIVPLCLASSVTGVIQSLATRWGLVRHYWVVIKIVITVLSTAVLLVHARRITELADLAARLSLAPDDHRGVWVQLAFDAGAALVVLAVATALAVYKPRGLTRHGRRTERGSPTALRWTRADR